MFGVAIFLAFLLLATQVLVHLYAVSTVTAVAFDSARRASAAGGACADVQADARARLGSWGTQPGVEVSCFVDRASDTTEVVISGPSPARGLGVLGGGAVDRIERGASFRTERLHEEPLP